METTCEQAHAGHETHGHHHCPNVTFHVNNKEVYAYAGRYPVATVKTLSAAR